MTSGRDRRTLVLGVIGIAVLVGALGLLAGRDLLNRAPGPAVKPRHPADAAPPVALAFTAPPVDAGSPSPTAFRPQDPAFARVEALLGTVTWLVGADRKAAQEGEPAQPGASLATASPTSRARILFGDGVYGELHPGTTVAMGKGIDDPATTRGLALLGGTLDIILPRNSSRFSVASPHAQIGMDAPARLQVEVSSVMTRVVVIEGTARIATAASAVGTLISPQIEALVGPTGEIRQVSRRRPVCLLVVPRLDLDPSTQAIRLRLERLGFDVRPLQPSTGLLFEARSARLMAVGTGIPATALDRRLRALPIPIVAWNSAAFEALAMTGACSTGHCGQAAVTAVVVEAQNHILSGRLGGDASLAFTPGINFGVPEKGAIRVASIPGDAKKLAVFAYETHATTLDGPAPARRVGLFMTANTALQMEPAGWRLFDVAVAWAVSAQ